MLASEESGMTYLSFTVPGIPGRRCVSAYRGTATDFLGWLRSWA